MSFDEKTARPESPSREPAEYESARSSPECFVYPDTNVFLHARPLEELPILSIVNSKSVTVVVTMTVIEELDSQKWKHRRAEIRERAGERVKLLLKWKDAGSPDLCPAVKLIIRQTHHSVDLKSRHLNPEVRDDHLFGEILESMAAESLARHVLLTFDSGPLLRAEPLGIEACFLPDEFRLPISDERDKKLLALQTENSALRNRLPELSVESADGKSHAGVEIARPKAMGEEGIQRRLLAARQAVPQIVPDPPDQFELNVAMMRRVDGARVRQYNTELDTYFRDLEVFLREGQSVLAEFSARVMSLPLVLRNTGTASATGVSITLEIPSEVAAHLAPPKPPVSAPSPPEKPKSVHDELWNRELFTPIDPTLFQPREKKNVRGPFIDGSTIEYLIDEARHSLDYRLPEVFLLLPPLDRARGLRITYRVLAREIPKPVEKAIDVKIVLVDSTA